MTTGTGPRDHPRTRGVYGDGPPQGLYVRGSSPHTRGLPATVTSVTATRRIIPAHAGFTRHRPRRTSGMRDHPRTRGVYTPCGNISGDGLDHPRTRGVYARPCSSSWARTGSSPHTRGLPISAIRSRAGGRIIPAHAGFTIRDLCTARNLQDHPRTRGVYLLDVYYDGHKPGSSPHTRGLREGGTMAVCWLRIIPAHAGFTTYWKCLEVNCTDHPRTRGVYAVRSAELRYWYGSSPHTRGLRNTTRYGGRSDRIIPAHAGFTMATWPAEPTASDHPRTRGVYDSCRG